MNGHNERRESLRIPFVQQVTMLTTQGNVNFSESSNLSLGGIFLTTETPLSINTTGLLMITFIEPNGKKTIISTDFKVIHVIEKDNLNNLPTGIGVEFTFMDDQSQASLKRIINQIKSGSSKEK